MTTFFLDPEGGNDANDGLSFAARWKTIANGATAARIAPGDTVRVIASPAPHTLGSAAWTDNTRTVVLGAAKTETIDHCETAWTAAANVTCTAPTSGMKQGAAYVRAAVASAFTTGKIAHRTLPAPLDLSAFEQASSWFACSVDANPGVFELRLCSDTTGDVAVHTIPLPDGSVAKTGSGWQVAVKDFGGPLSSGVNSLALYANSDIGSCNLDLDNIVACKAKGSADELTHLSLIGKNTAGEPEWYPVLHIDGATVHLGADYMAAMNSLPRPYRGTSESVETYALQPLVNVDATYNASGVADSGADGALITFSGGWSRTDMATQDGETWWSASHNGNWVLDFSYRDYVASEKIGVAHAKVSGAKIGGKFTQVALLGAVGCYRPIEFVGDTTYPVRGMALDFGNLMHCYYGLELSKNRTPGVRVKGRRISGIRGGNAYYAASYRMTPVVSDIGAIDNNAQYGISGAGSILRGTTFANNGSGDVVMAATEPDDFVAIGCTFAAPPTVPTALNSHSRIRLHKYNGAETDHRIIAATWAVATDAVTTHSTGISWKFVVTNTASEPLVSKGAPAEISLAKFAVAANSPVTCKTWVRRDNADMHIGIKVLRDTLAGIEADVTAEITADADTWQEISLTFTPTEAGVVELLGYAYAASTLYAGWWDDVSFSQV